LIDKLVKRFDELERESNLLEESKHEVREKGYQTINGEPMTRTFIDNEKFLSWKVKVKNIIVAACGENSQHFKEFVKEEGKPSYGTNLNLFNRLRPIFTAAKEDFVGGYVVSVKALVQAEVFDSELEQARELLSKGYKVAAAVIAGVVLETSIRDLCNTEGLPLGKLDRMNSELAKAGIYSKLQQKKVTALADIRNSAAHGESNSFTDQDVEAMIRDVENFLLDYLS